jgi:arginine repressor
LPELLATLSGENVVFVAPKSTQYIAKIFVSVCKALHYKIRKEDHHVK